ncbi:tail fiber protein [uncultured phage_MedDCM-OCT-S37-C6]|uniref:Fiber protein n=1 Tax=uncultured phage_MedDCM-OCT-S37-C6 TaxID=2740804 RepID=A0A6S4P9Z3_9CAUD|nr:tail fiber protein [uncultured phage_MedDCM-OCT-S37-C6]BAQ94345.1 fiber protein [uncultured phage_MedDCM-OCT-S37-C6]
MPIFNNILAGAAGQSGGGGFVIEKSLRFKGDADASLTRTPTTAGSQSAFTLSTWVKRSLSTTYEYLMWTTTSFYINFTAGDVLEIALYAPDGSSWAVIATSQAKFRDPSAWYHIVVSVDSSAGTTNADRLKLWVNGVESPLTYTVYWGGLITGNISDVNTTIQHEIGARNAYPCDFYLADYYWIDGQALAATDFGEYDDNGVWQPKKFAGTHGTNGFHLDFSDDSTQAALGTDSSGNNNTWLVHNLTHTGTIYQNNGSITVNNGRTDSAGSFANVFNGTVNANAANAYGFLSGAMDFTWILDTPLSFSSQLRVWTGFAGGTVYLNDDTTGVSSVNNGYTTLATSAGTLSKIRFTVGSGGGWWAGVLFDGNLLTSGNPPDFDSLIDTPTNYEADSGNNGGNYAVWNPLTLRTYNSSTASLSNGNLNFDISTTGYASVVSTVATGTSGKYYCEISFSGSRPTSVNIDYIGVVPVSSYNTFDSSSNESDLMRALNALSITASTTKVQQCKGTGSNNPNTDWVNSAGIDADDVVGIGIDCDTNTLTFYKNGTSLGTYPHSLESGTSYLVFITDWGNTGTQVSSFILNAGQRPFAYTPPTGYKSLCTTNLDDPLIADSSTAFNVALWTGNGSTQSVTTGISPDLVWIKSRSFATDHALFDTVRGATKRLRSNQTNAENTDANTLTVFNSDGFSLGSSSAVNLNNGTFAAWAWDGGDLVSNSTSSHNQSQTWSNGWTGNSGSSGRVPTNAFDGDLTTLAFPGNNSANEYVEYSFTAIPVNTSLEFYLSFDSGGAQRGQLWVNDTNVTSSLGSGNAQWFTVTGQSTLSKIKILTTATNYYVNLHAVRVDGKILIDPGVIPAGGLNSSFYNTSDTWSDDLSSPQGAYGSSSVANAFDGSLTVGFEAGNPSGNYSTIRFQPASAITVNSSLRIHVFDLNNANVAYQYRVNDGSWTSWPGTSSPYRIWRDLGFTGTLNSFEYRSSTNSSYKPTLYAVEIDGKMLINSGTSLSGLTQYPSIASTVRANPSAGFSIVSYAGSSSAATVGHGLNAKPSLVIVKNRTTASNWPTWHEGLGDGTKYLSLHDDGGENTSSAYWNSTEPTSTTVSLGTTTGVNEPGGVHIAYCFAPVEGYSAFGTYLGNLDANGSFAFCGFAPALVVVKASSASGNWYAYDRARGQTNPNDNELYWNLDSQEYTINRDIDFLSNGFKIRTNDSGFNASGVTYIWMAWAESPFKTSRAR